MDEGAFIWLNIMTRFFDRVREKACDVSQAPVLICALGDSVTQGVMEHKVLDSSAVYHRRLQLRLEEFYPTTTFSTLNAGVSGGNAPQALERLERDVIRHSPDLVLVAFGLNDSMGGEDGLPTFSAAMREIVAQVRSGTDAAVVLLTPPFMAKTAGVRVHSEHCAYVEQICRSQNEGVLARYAQAIRDVAEETSAALVDVHAEWNRLAETGLDTDLWLINGLNHPDARGHELTATLVFHTLLSSRS